MDGDDVRVGQPRRRAGLLQEALAQLGHPGQVRREQLDGDRPLEREVPAQEDDAHAAPAQLAFQQVAAAEGGLERDELSGHGSPGRRPWRRA